LIDRFDEPTSPAFAWSPFQLASLAYSFWIAVDASLADALMLYDGLARAAI